MYVVLVVSQNLRVKHKTCFTLASQWKKRNTVGRSRGDRFTHLTAEHAVNGRLPVPGGTSRRGRGWRRRWNSISTGRLFFGSCIDLLWEWSTAKQNGYKSRAILTVCYAKMKHWWGIYYIGGFKKIPNIKFHSAHAQWHGAEKILDTKSPISIFFLLEKLPNKTPTNISSHTCTVLSSLPGQWWLGMFKKKFLSTKKKRTKNLSHFSSPFPPPPHSPSQTPNSIQHLFNRSIIIKSSLFWLLPRPLTQSIVHKIGLKNFKGILRVTDQYILENAMTQYGRLTGAIREYT